MIGVHKASSFAYMSSRIYRNTFQLHGRYLFGKMYTKNHEWIESDGKPNKYKIGITNYAQEQLGEIVYVEVSNKNKFIDTSSSIAVVESVKTTSDVYAPANGKIIDSNPDLIDNPSLLNQKPEETWICEIECQS